MHQRRQRPHIIGQLLADIPQRLDFELGRRIGDGQATNLAIRVPEGDGSLVGFDSITKIVEEIL